MVDAERANVQRHRQRRRQEAAPQQQRAQQELQDCRRVAGGWGWGSGERAVAGGRGERAFPGEAEGKLQCPIGGTSAAHLKSSCAHECVTDAHASNDPRHQAPHAHATDYVSAVVAVATARPSSPPPPPRRGRPAPVACHHTYHKAAGRAGSTRCSAHQTRTAWSTQPGREEGGAEGWCCQHAGSEAIHHSSGQLVFQSSVWTGMRATEPAWCASSMRPAAHIARARPLTIRRAALLGGGVCCACAGTGLR